MTKKNSVLQDIVIFAFVIVLAFTASMLVREYFFIVTKVEGISMNDTLYDKDIVYIFTAGRIKRGDIVMLENPNYNPEDENSHQYFIKRVIGIPNDIVEIKPDGVYINGQKQDEPYTKGDTVPLAGNGKYEVPAQKYFVMGDNRENSTDSRFFSFIKKDAIKGKAVLVIREKKWKFVRSGGRLAYEII